ncbi:MAG: Rieske 2Fe-2S domain-containing protein [Acidobacteriota bacterium]|nr:Rieske 2Fe-2S domain-containing protein [Acidobacteriota bacterium]
MANFFLAAEAEDLPPGSCAVVTVAGKDVALFNAGGKIYALDNTCLHRGGPLGEGELEGEIVTCPWHGWQYNVRTGEKCGDPAKKIGCYGVKVENNLIFVDV